MNLIKKQKYALLVFIFLINLLLITTFMIYHDKWYVFLCFLALASIINASSVVLVLVHKMFDKPVGDRTEGKNYIYIIPCYNESFQELQTMLDSLVNQQTLKTDKRSLLIICDGCVTGQGNELSTDNILKQILDTTEDYGRTGLTYKTWDGKENDVTLYEGAYKDLLYLLIIKNTNYGKRDSLVLARRLCYDYNSNTNLLPHDNEALFQLIEAYFTDFYGDVIEYIIGIDADTIFAYTCSYELLKTMEQDPDVVGCVGLVDILPTFQPWSPFVLYQYAEYHIAQSLRRYTQSNITGKVSCLSGCNQILKICTETCGKAILDKFNYLPLETDDIFKHIRSFASEDRNHVCQMLSMFPHVKTKQNMCAVAYTTVPTSLSIFFSQRRRWSLGATTNDLLLTYLPGINIFERISAVVNCMNYVLSPFICIASVILIKSFIEGVTYLMLMLGIIMIIPQCYYILIPLFQGFYFRQSLYFYLSYIVFLCLAIPTNMCIFLNSVFNMDVLKWGKTRSISAPTERVGTDVIIQVNVRTTYSDDDKETDC